MASIPTINYKPAKTNEKYTERKKSKHILIKND